MAVGYWTADALRVLSQESTFTVGVDLGQKRDHTAVTVLESVEMTYDWRDPVTYEFRRDTRIRLRHAERVRLGTPYPDVVRLVKELVSLPELSKRRSVVVDATGVGAPVVDLLRQGQLGCALVPVTITSGAAASSDGTMHRVPKRDLMAGLQVLFEDERFSIAPGMCDGQRLVEELRGMRSKVTASGRGRYEGSKDDLVLALALAWWWARKGSRGIWGTRRLL